MHCSLGGLPSKESGSAPGSFRASEAQPGCEEPGHQKKLVNLSQTSACTHLELPRVTCPTALSGFMHPHHPDSGRRMQRNWLIPGIRGFDNLFRKDTVSKLAAEIGGIT